MFSQDPFPVAATREWRDLCLGVTSRDANNASLFFKDALGHWYARMRLAERFAPPARVVWKRTTHVVLIERINGIKIDLWPSGVMPTCVHPILPNWIMDVPPLNVSKPRVRMLRSSELPIFFQR
jgi:hypothetical protein